MSAMTVLTELPTLVSLPQLVHETGLEHPTADFSDTPLWLSLVKAVGIFAYLLLSVLLVIWFERRVIGRMQQRLGPNRAGPWGILQSLADGVKSMLKEDLRPVAADRIVFTLSPVLFACMAFVAFSIIPLGPTVSMFGHETPLQLTDLPVAVLVVLAAAGVAVYGIVMAGWSSASTYPLLGGLRSAAQIISYEIAMGLALVAVFLYSGSMATSQIVTGQSSMWYVLPAFFSFVIYVVTMVGETNRLPVDLAEGEGELVGGYFTEYSGMRFAMFFLAEYINMFTVSALATTIFLGGWQAPPGLSAIGDGMFNEGWWPLLWFTIKLWMFMYFFVWLRGSLPRTRYDQFMAFGWKFLIPVTLLWVVAVAFIRGAQQGFLGSGSVTIVGREFPVATIFIIGFIAVVAFVTLWVWEGVQEKREARLRPSTPDEVDPFAGGHPVPPLPGQRLADLKPTGDDTASRVTATATVVETEEEDSRG